MTEPSNDRQDVRNASAPTPRREYRVDDAALSKTSWSVLITDSRMIVRNADGDKYFEVPHESHFKYMDLVESGNRLLLILRQETKAVIQIESQLYDTLDQWRGYSTPAWLRYDLRGAVIKLVVGLLFLGPSLADLGRYFKDGRAIERQGWEGLCLGTMMVAIVALTHFKPHKFVILMDVAWWIGLLLFHVQDAIRQPGLWSVFWIVLPILFGYLRYRMYWKHASREPQGSATAPGK